MWWKCTWPSSCSVCRVPTPVEWSPTCILVISNQLCGGAMPSCKPDGVLAQSRRPILGFCFCPSPLCLLLPLIILLTKPWGSMCEALGTIIYLLLPFVHCFFDFLMLKWQTVNEMRKSMPIYKCVSTCARSVGVIRGVNPILSVYQLWTVSLLMCFDKTGGPISMFLIIFLITTSQRISCLSGLHTHTPQQFLSQTWLSLLWKCHQDEFFSDDR